MIGKRQREPGDCLVSTVLFDNFSEVIHDRVPLERVHKLTEKEYFVRACPAAPLAAGWKSRIEADFKKRGKKN